MSNLPVPPADLSNLIPLTKAPDYLPRDAKGRKKSHSCVFRWATKGARGRKLAAWRIGRTLYTSKEALAEFASFAGDSDSLVKSPVQTSSRPLSGPGQADPSIAARVAAARARLRALR